MIKVDDLVRYGLDKREVVIQESKDGAIKLILETNILTKEVKFHVIDKIGVMSFNTIEESIKQYNKLAF